MINKNISEARAIDSFPELEPEDKTHSAEAKALIKELENSQIVYESALKEIKTKLDILNDEFKAMHSRNPIHTMQSRVKTPKSIIQKLIRKGCDLNMRQTREEVEDIAGIRIICPYIKDIYLIKQLVENQDDLEVERIVDYIKNPKPNGYRSLHMIMKVPVFFSDHKDKVKVEIQIRTIAMDFWASLEHQLRYKKANSQKIPPDISEELKDCADIIASTDIRMQDIHNRLYQ